MRPAIHYGDLDVAALLAYTADMGTLAELVGVTRFTLHRLTHIGLTVEQADMFASALGAHPAIVWPAWTDPGDPMRRAFCRWCSRQIIQPVRQGARLRRTCSRRCRDALSRARHLDDRRAVDRDRWHANRTPERLAVHAARERARRAHASSQPTGEANAH